MSSPEQIFLKVSLSEDDEQIVILEEVQDSSGQSLGELRETPTKNKVDNKRVKTSERNSVKSFQPVTQCCLEFCCRKVTEAEQENLYSQFCQEPKAVQDVILSGLMRCQTPKTCRVTPVKRRDNIWRYFVLPHGEEISVCQKFLREVYQVTEKRLRVIQQKTINCEAFGERRGKHKNRPGSIRTAVWDLAREHLSLIPSNKGLDGSSEKRYFTDSNLNVKKLYDLFKVFYKERTGKELEKLAYKTYHKFFLREQKYGFLSQLTITIKSDYLKAGAEDSNLSPSRTEKPVLRSTKASKSNTTRVNTIETDEEEEEEEEEEDEEDDDW